MFWGTASTGLLLAAALGLATAGPSGSGAKVTKEQLAYSKKMFAEGDAAMEEGDYQTALAKFQEGYRYAPHLHIFTYNIAQAADSAGNCQLARQYYQMFVDLVPKHPERKQAKAKLEEFQKTCLEDQETTEVISKESTKQRKIEREVALAQAAMNEALYQLRVAREVYASGKSRFKSQRTFNAAARHKKWNARRMAKLLPKHDVEEEDREIPTPEVPTEHASACRAAKIQENRTIRALEKARDTWDTRESYRVLSRFLRFAERDLEKFESCS